MAVSTRPVFGELLPTFTSDDAAQHSDQRRLVLDLEDQADVLDGQRPRCLSLKPGMGELQGPIQEKVGVQRQHDLHDHRAGLDHRPPHYLSQHLPADPPANPVDQLGLAGQPPIRHRLPAQEPGRVRERHILRIAPLQGDLVVGHKAGGRIGEEPPPIVGMGRSRPR
jgi:hypothetical protein